MVDEIAHLLLADAASGYHAGSDAASDRVLAELSGTSLRDACDGLSTLARVPSLTPFLSLFDTRATPSTGQDSFTRLVSSSTAHAVVVDACDRLARQSTRAVLPDLFAVSEHAAPGLRSPLAGLRDLTFGRDPVVAVGAVVLACALRRKVVSSGGSV